MNVSGTVALVGPVSINSTGSNNTTIGNTGTITLNGVVNATGLTGYATTTALALKANTLSPTFTGTVTIPSGASISGYAPLAGPNFTGTPQISGVNIATTADVALKANTANPTFTGTVSIGSGTGNPLSISNSRSVISLKTPTFATVGQISVIGFGSGGGSDSDTFPETKTEGGTEFSARIKAVTAGDYGTQSDLFFQIKQSPNWVGNGQGNYTNVLILKSNGNVGIGTTAPASKLDVNGNVNVTGDIVLKAGGCTPTINPRIQNAEDHRLYIYMKPDNLQGLFELSSAYGVYNIPYGNIANSENNGGFTFRSVTQANGTGNTRFYIANSGNVGVGTTTPSERFEVAGNIRYSGNIAASSDRRIKSNIIDLEDDIALQLIRRIKPKTYTYRDTKKRGLEHVYGFIAQEVRDVLNYATSTCTDAIPNIYEQVILTDDLLSFTDFKTTDLVKDASGELFTTIRLTINEVEQKVTILQVIDEHTVKVDLSKLTIDASGQLVPGNKIFVYGQEVNDFHTLNKDAIWTVATAALQEVDRQLQAEKQKTALLETTLASTQETLASVLARLVSLEQR